MIDHSDIRARAEEWSLREDVVEKDYVLGWVLWAIGSDPRLRDGWVFKGGTCLKKCYLDTFRFSEDLDFTVTDSSLSEPEVVEIALGDLLQRASAESGIDFSVREPRLRTRRNGSLEGRVYYRGPRRARTPASVRIDLTPAEVVARPPVLRPIRHLYPDELPEPGTVRCYSLEEVFAEKLRAMGERGRPRDLYDVIFLFRNPGLERQPAVILEVLEDKCRSKQVAVPTLESISKSTTLAELESEWENMLAHQVPRLAPLDHYWSQLAELFDWLEGAAEPPELARAPGTGQVVWEPSPSRWTWGSGPALETLRFAGANRLCVDLGYKGRVRRIEPYSLRTTRDGHLLLHSVRVDSRQHRSYRVDRIQSIEVTTQAFKPVYLVEFTTGGPIAAPRQRRAQTSRGSWGATSADRPYRVECPYCGKRFPRTRPSTGLNRHKTPDGYPCPARSGYLV